MARRGAERTYHRRESPSQTAAIAAQQQATGEMWGRAPRGSDVPAVQAYVGPLPFGIRGVEFTTDVLPDPGSPPGQAYWRGPRPGVVVEDEFAKIRCMITKNAQTRTGDAMHVRQVQPHERWPSGDSRAIAVLAAEPDELTARYGMTFEEGADDLDYSRLAALVLADGSQIWLMRHRGNPEPGTVVYADATADANEARRLLAHSLGMYERDFTWIAPVPAPLAATVRGAD